MLARRGVLQEVGTRGSPSHRSRAAIEIDDQRSPLCGKSSTPQGRPGQTTHRDCTVGCGSGGEVAREETITLNDPAIEIQLRCRKIAGAHCAHIERAIVEHDGPGERTGSSGEKQGSSPRLDQTKGAVGVCEVGPNGAIGEAGIDDRFRAAESQGIAAASGDGAAVQNQTGRPGAVADGQGVAAADGNGVTGSDAHGVSAGGAVGDSLIGTHIDGGSGGGPRQAVGPGGAIAGRGTRVTGRRRGGRYEARPRSIGDKIARLIGIVIGDENRGADDTVRVGGKGGSRPQHGQLLFRAAHLDAQGGRAVGRRENERARAACRWSEDRRGVGRVAGVIENELAGTTV